MATTPILTLIEGGELFTPEPSGVKSLLLAGQLILKIGAIDIKALASLDVLVQQVDARGCYVVPGFIDPHANVIGAGGEQGFGSRQPELRLEQLLRAGITTVVGILGADATTRTLQGVLGKVREFTNKGITGLMYTGAMQTPPPTITGSIVDDMILIPEVIGMGEVAIADERSTEPSLAQLAHWVSQAFLGGNTGGKAGVTRFHIGTGRRRLTLLNQLLDEYDIPPRCLHPTHVTRTKELIPEAVALAKRGCYVDTDTVDEGTAQLFVNYLEQGGPPERFTFSSDAQTPGGTPDKFYREFIDCVHRHHMPLERALPHFTAFTAKALKLPHKGVLRENADADLLVLHKDSLEIRHVIARGAISLYEGRVCQPEGANT